MESLFLIPLRPLCKIPRVRSHLKDVEETTIVSRYILLL